MLKIVALYMLGELLEIVVFFLFFNSDKDYFNFFWTKIMVFMVNMAESSVVKYKILAV